MRKRDLSEIKKYKLQLIIRVVCMLLILFNLSIVISSLVNSNKVSGVLSYKPLIVSTDATQFNIKKGALLIIKDIDIDKYKVNDIVVYKKDGKENLVAQVSEKEDNDEETILLLYNYGVDYKITKDNVQGIKVLSIPFIGYIVLFLQSPLGVVFFILSLILMVLWYIYGLSEEH